MDRPWRLWRIPGLVVVIGLALGGCPMTAAPDTTGPGGGSTNSPGGGSDGGTTDNGSGGGTTVSGDNCIEPIPAASWRAEILALVNAERTSRGVNPVAQNDILEAQADQYACEMITEDFFAHVNPVTGSTLSDRAEQFGYDYSAIGENLAAGQRSPQEVMDDWMDSPGHRANILEPQFTELGIGIREGGEFGLYWVQEFGRPRNASSRSVVAGYSDAVQIGFGD